MLGQLTDFFSSERFMPHGMCLLWEPGMLGLHVASDAIITLAYYTIPVALLYFVRRRTDLAYPWLFSLFGIFILGCGTTHLLGIWVLWHPAYGLDGMVKLVTAVASIGTAIVVWKVMPGALAIPSTTTLADRVQQQTAALTAANERLVEEAIERKRAERDLARSERRFRDFADIASDWLWETDPDGRFTYVSARVDEIGGFGSGELIGRRREELDIIDRSQPGWLAYVEALARREPFRNAVYGWRTHAGEMRYVRISGTPVVDASGAYLGFRGTASNVTAEVEAEHRAERSRLWLVDAIESLPASFILFDRDERLILCNSRHAALIPAARDLLVPGTTLEQLVRFAAEREVIDAPHGKESWVEERLAKIRRGEDTVEQAWTDGRWYHLFERRTSEGGLVSIRLDITDRKQAEAAREESLARLQMILDRMPVGCIVNAPDLRFTYWNAAAERMFGWRFEEVRGKHPFETITPPERQRPVADTLRALIGGAQTADSIGESLTKDGRRIECEWRNTALRQADGAFVGMLSMCVDITERRQIEEQLRQAQKMQAVGQLTGGVAHDFNNLLAVIVGNLDMVGEMVAGQPKISAMTASAMRAAERGAALTQRLLAFARRQSLHPRAIDLNALIDGTGDLLRRTLGETVDIRVALAPNLWPTLADPSQLENALLNLAINARDAMPKGGQLTIETANRTLDATYAAREPEVNPGDYVVLAVSDTGTGMAPEVVERAFEPFFTTKAQGQGTGLGLSTVYGFVKQSGGHVKIYSEPGHGTTVRIYLPRSPGTAASEPAHAAEAPPKGSETILAVEDDEEVRTLVTNLLRDLGYTVVTAADGPSALTVLEQHPEIGLLFTDMVMPGGLNGADLAHEARRRHPGLRVLFTSGYAEAAVLRSAGGGGEFDMLSKPYRKQELAQKLREAFDRTTC